MVLQVINSSTSGHRYFDRESSRFDLNKKRKRSHIYRKPTDDEYAAALALLELSCSGGSYCNRPTTSPDAVEATKITARMAASALGLCNVKKVEPCSTVIIAPPLAQCQSYPCTMCGKSFASYQALGGHKTRHCHRPLITTTNSTLKVFELKPSGKIHQCSACNKSFSTGQALGGHMRRHYDGVIGGGKKINVITSEGGDSSDYNSNGNGRTPHDFDLNISASPETYLDLTLCCSENL